MPRSAAATGTPIERHCHRCGALFRWTGVATGRPRAQACGRLICQAVLTWGDLDWAGQLRMADARTAAGLAESELDAMARQHAARHERAARLPPSTASSPVSPGPAPFPLGDPR